MSDGGTFCLTLDLENDWYLDDAALDHLVLAHLEEFLDLVDDLGVPLSVFAVGRTIEEHPWAVDRLRSALDCEFHLHSYRHDTSRSYEFETEVRRGMVAFREHFGHDPVGYRAPQGAIDPREFGVLEDLGFQFDSSVFPSYRPGKYNNLAAPTEPYVPASTSSLLEIPFGTIRGLRIPVALSYCKLFGRPLAGLLSVAPLPDVLVYNVHLHDLYETASHGELDQPKRWIMRRNIDRAESVLRRSVSAILSRGYEPATVTEVYDECAG